MARFYLSWQSFVLVTLVVLLTAGCTAGTADAQYPPDPPTPTPSPPPQCQQDDHSRPISKQMRFSPDWTHFAEVISDVSDARYDRVLTDGIPVETRFDRDTVGPIVFYRDNWHFAFSADAFGKKYVLEYASKSLTPEDAYPVDEVWNKWVCYGATGKYLFALVRQKQQWSLVTRAQITKAPYVPYPIVGVPDSLELLPHSEDSSEGVQYSVTQGSLKSEIKSWLK